MSAAPGVSPWTQSVSTSSLRKVPSAVLTPPFRTNKSACAAAAAGLVISAPASVLILRQELCDAVKAENLAAARAGGDEPQINRFKEWLAHPSSTPR